MKVNRNMVPQIIEALLREKIGLEPQSLPQKGLSRIIHNRMRARGLPEEGAYLALLSSEPEEWEELIDAVVVHETWFFRDYEPFVFLKKHVFTWQAAAGRPPLLRVLSVPAATGEEPYSIAMTLLDAGLQATDFTIDALEISRKALQKALPAVYGQASFREQDRAYRQSFFTPVEGGYQLDPAVAKRVRFVRGNLLDYPDLTISGPYEIIFFRNLLIYLNPLARQQAISIIDAMLQDGGLLFLGYAELPQVFFPHYSLVDHPRSYAARKPSGLPEAERAAATAADSQLKIEREILPPPFTARGSWKVGIKVDRYRGLQRSSPRRAEPQPLAASVERQVGDQRGDRDALLGQARHLADQGNLEAAASLCRDLLKTEPTFAEPYFLLGVIALAQGDEEQARESFNRAVYLQPDHRDALMHLSLLMEKTGLHDQAKTYRERFHRIGAREGTGKRR